MKRINNLLIVLVILILCTGCTIDYKLEITDDALYEIANVSNKLQTGARALRSVVEKVLEDIMFNAPDNIGNKRKAKVVVDKDYVLEKTKKMTEFVDAA